MSRSLFFSCRSERQRVLHARLQLLVRLLVFLLWLVPCLLGSCAHEIKPRAFLASESEIPRNGTLVGFRLRSFIAVPCTGCTLLVSAGSLSLWIWVQRLTSKRGWCRWPLDESSFFVLIILPIIYVFGRLTSLNPAMNHHTSQPSDAQ